MSLITCSSSDAKPYNDAKIIRWSGKFYKLMSPLCEFASSSNCFIVSVAFDRFVETGFGLDIIFKFFKATLTFIYLFIYLNLNYKTVFTMRTIQYKTIYSTILTVLALTLLTVST